MFNIRIFWLGATLQVRPAEFKRRVLQCGEGGVGRGWLHVCMFCFVFFLKASSEGIYLFVFFAVLVQPHGQRAHRKLREKETFRWEVKEAFGPPDSYLETPACFLLFLTYGVLQPELVCILEKIPPPPGEVWTDLDPWPPHRPRRGQTDNPDPPPAPKPPFSVKCNIQSAQQL